MKKLLVVFLLGVSTVFFNGCSSLSHSDKAMLNEMKLYGARDYEEVKSPAVAGVLQILPGIGNFYLASGTDESTQVTAGVLNILPGWLIWPVGILWAAPQAVIDAGIINQKEAIQYYSFDPAGKQELSRLKADYEKRNGTL